MNTVIATANGEYSLNSKHKKARSAVYASGNMGTATAKLVYKTVDGTPVALKDSTITAGEQLNVQHGIGLEVFASVSGANASTKIEFKCAGID